MGLYDYYKDICNCNAGSSSAGDGSLYQFYSGYCVCVCEKVYLGIRDADGNEAINYPVAVYNVNEVLIGNANTKNQVIALWNSDPDNQLVGVLKSGIGPFGFFLIPVECNVAPPWVIGVSTNPPSGSGGSGGEDGIITEDGQFIMTEDGQIIKVE